MKELTKKRFEKKLQSYEKIDQVVHDMSRYKKYAEVAVKIRKDGAFDINKMKKNLAEQLYRSNEEVQKKAFMRAFNKIKEKVWYTVVLYGNNVGETEINVKLATLYYRNITAAELKSIIKKYGLSSIDIDDSDTFKDIANKTGAVDYKLEMKGQVKRVMLLTKVNTNKR